MLPFDALPTRELLSELDRWRERLDSRGPLVRAWAGRLRRDIEAESVAASTSMEGVAVTAEEVRRILAGDVPPSVSAADAALVRGYRDAMSFVLRRADDPAFQWNREVLIGIHDRVLAGSFGEGAGRFRSGTIEVVDGRSGEIVFTPPDGAEIPQLLDRVSDELRRSKRHPALDASWVHVAIAAVHPFRDGNGRTARILASLAMYRGGFKRPEFCSLEEWWGRHRDDHYAAFRSLGPRFDAAADVTPFVVAHVGAQVEQVRGLYRQERIGRMVWTALENLSGERHLPLRLANVFWDAFHERVVTAGYYRQLADVSPATATADLRSAAAAGLLQPHGERRGRRYLADPALYAAVREELGLPLLPERESRKAILNDLATMRLPEEDGDARRPGPRALVTRRS